MAIIDRRAELYQEHVKAVNRLNRLVEEHNRVAARCNAGSAGSSHAQLRVERGAIRERLERSHVGEDETIRRQIDELTASYERIAARYPLGLALVPGPTPPRGGGVGNGHISERSKPP